MNHDRSCHTCGRPAADSALFCSFCGAQLPPTPSTTTRRSTIGELLPDGALIGPLERYRVIRTLGAGGFGQAVLAEERKLNRLCVVKHLVIKPEWNRVAQEWARDTFEREARLLATLNQPGHPNIPDIYEYLDEDWCLVMKYIEGHSLADMLDQRGPLPEEEALRYTRDVCHAICYMHDRSKPVLHRDIKPGNILVDQQARTWLIDFGLAKATPAVSVSTIQTFGSLPSGSPGYMPLEQWQGTATPSSDVYALGVTLHTLLTAVDPAQIEKLSAGWAGSPAATDPAASAPRSSHFTALRTYNPAIRPAVEQLVARATHSDPVQRPTAQALLAEFNMLLAGLAIQPAPAPAELPEYPIFVGRQQNLNALAQQLRLHGSAVITGAAGSGKTALAATLAQRLGRPERTFWHRFGADDGDPWLSLTQALSGFIAHCGHKQLWAQMQRARQFDGSTLPDNQIADAVLHGLAQQQSIVCLDNLAASDGDPRIAELVRRLQNAAEQCKLTLIATARDLPDGWDEHHQHELAGLDIRDAQQLANQNKIALSPIQIAEVHRQTNGNPQLLITALDTLKRSRIALAEPITMPKIWLLFVLYCIVASLGGAVVVYDGAQGMIEGRRIIAPAYSLGTLFLLAIPTAFFGVAPFLPRRPWAYRYDFTLMIPLIAMGIGAIALPLWARPKVKEFFGAERRGWLSGLMPVRQADPSRARSAILYHFALLVVSFATSVVMLSICIQAVRSTTLVPGQRIGLAAISCLICGVALVLFWSTLHALNELHNNSREAPDHRAKQPAPLGYARIKPYINPLLCVVMFGLLIPLQTYIPVDSATDAEILHKAAIALQNGHYEQAISLYSTVLAHDQENDAAYYGRGEAYRLKGDLDRAIADYGSFIQRHPQEQDRSAAAYYGRGEAYRLKGDLVRAIADYGTAIDVQPNHSEAYHARGLAYYTQRNFDRALSDLNESLRLNPLSAATYNDRGLVYSQQGQTELAINDFRKAINISPDLLNAYSNLGWLYLQQGQRSMAKEQFDRALQKNQQNADAHAGLGRVYLDQQQFDLAIDENSQAIALYSKSGATDYAVIFYNRGLAYQAKGAWTEAQRDYEYVLANSKDQGLKQRAKDQLLALGITK